MMPNFSYTRVATVEEALGLLSSPRARLHAGGTDLLGCLRDHVFDATTVVSVSRIKALQGIAETTDGGLRIGALTTIAEIAENSLVRQKYPGLAQAALSVASPQLRNQGTLGGNLCQKPRCWYYRGEFHCLRKGGDRCYAVTGENHYHCVFGGEGCFIVHPSDVAPMLTALEATVRVANPAGIRPVRIADFFVLPEKDPTRETVLGTGEIVTDVIIPRPFPGLKSSYRKVRARRSWDFALVGVALAVRFDQGTVKEALVVLSGAAPVPWRSVDAEKAITGRKLNAATAAEAAAAAVKGARPLEHNGYKVPLLRGIIEEELTAMAQG
jgi:xanthine dehydrogenase YagS FAD-binding subunit